MRLLWIFCLCASIATAQEELFPQQYGVDLLESLATEYKPSGLLTYGEARDTMYKEVYRNSNGVVTCYYTGHTIFLPDNVDPTSFLYNDSDLNGITAEHLYPQSKGAGEGDPRSDMHSLVPAIWRVNEARSNYPFGEVPDDETDRWYLLTEDLREIPKTDIDLYSERLNGGFGNPGLFEPRESVKGDVARAIFYFYTMYKAEADAADPDFFEEMKEVLFTWHQQDPVDSLEFALNISKARFQQGKINPFINDCTLVNRAYFRDSDIELTCEGNFTSSIQEADDSEILAYPNPVIDLLNLNLKDNWKQSHYNLTTTKGQQLLSGQLDTSRTLDLSSLSPGLYFLALTNANGKALVKRITKL